MGTTRLALLTVRGAAIWHFDVRVDRVVPTYHARNLSSGDISDDNFNLEHGNSGFIAYQSQVIWCNKTGPKSEPWGTPPSSSLPSRKTQMRNHFGKVLVLRKILYDSGPSCSEDGLYRASGNHQYMHGVGNVAPDQWSLACVLGPTRLTPERQPFRERPPFSKRPLATLKECLCRKRKKKRQTVSAQTRRAKNRSQFSVRKKSHPSAWDVSGNW